MNPSEVRTCIKKSGAAEAMYHLLTGFADQVRKIGTGGAPVLAGRRTGFCSQVNDSTLDGNGNRLGPIAGSQLLHNVPDMHFDGFF